MRRLLFCGCVAALSLHGHLLADGAVAEAFSIEPKPATPLGDSVFLIDGLQIYLPDYQTSKWQQEMVKNGDFCDGGTMKQICEILSPNPVIVDIGAGIGIRSCYWAAKTDAIRVIAFEPIERNCEAIRRNVKINRLQRKVILNCLAIGEDDGQLDIADFDGNDPTKTQLRSSGSGGQIEAKRLDSVDMDVGRIDLISVNVNGFEEQVLAGARKTLAKVRPTYILIWSLGDEQTAADVDQLLTDSDYDRAKEFDGGAVLYHRID
jgi:FkbM family methyltransferase